MLNLIAIQGIIKGVIVCVFANILIIITLLFSSVFLNGGKNNIIQLPVVLPLVTIVASAFLRQDLKLRQGLIISVIWFFVFVAIEILKVTELGFNPINDIYSIFTITLVILIPIGVGLSNTEFFVNHKNFLD